ncbi:MAG: VCBS repeat-containing protein [Candidatus Midichloria sp.]|nr:VCBS repeat-containing protein [Candidatus Midichloria sp.]
MVKLFASAASYNVGSRPQAIAIGDINGNGKQDILNTNAGSNTITVLIGNGNGTFPSQQRITMSAISL